VLLAGSMDLATATVAARCRLPASSVRRHLQELSALGLCDLEGTDPERWCASAWLRTRWQVVDAPPPTPGSADQPASDVDPGKLEGLAKMAWARLGAGQPLTDADRAALRAAGVDLDGSTPPVKGVLV
jgi:hypothetical protein